MPQVTFYFDLGSPFAYLAAKRVRTLFPEPVEWQPVLLGGCSSWPAEAPGRSETTSGDRPAWPRSSAGPKLRISADTLARPVAGRLPDRNARGDVRVH